MNTEAPLSRAEENAFYGEPITATAQELGEQAVCEDIALVSEFLDECSDEREISEHFGFISVPELVALMLMTRAPAVQRAAALDEFRKRLVAHHATTVRREAGRSME